MIPRHWLVLREDGTPDAHIIAGTLEDALNLIPPDWTARPLKVSDDVADLVKADRRTYRSAPCNQPKRSANDLQYKSFGCYLTDRAIEWLQSQPNKSKAITELIEARCQSDKK